MKKLGALFLVLLLAGCGGFPQPFYGNPGATALRLAQPPPSRLAVPAPTDALLGDQAAKLYAGDLATRLADYQVPAVPGPAHPGDWRLAVAASLQGAQVVPRFTIMDPLGKPHGMVIGAPVSAQDWANGAAPALAASARSSAGKISELLTTIQARMARIDPNSLLNRPARLYFAGVSGAPGDGDAALTLQIRAALVQAGETLLPSETGADMVVHGVVRVTPPKAGQQRVEVQWIIADARGERGRVVQLNNVPAGSLSQHWGQVAEAVAQQAAPGIRRVIRTSAGGGLPRKPLADAPAPGAHATKP